MKTTVELDDDLARQVKALAAAQGSSLRSFVEEALRRELDRRRQSTSWQPRPDLVFTGTGLTPEAQGLPWRRLRGLSERQHADDTP